MHIPLNTGSAFNRVQSRIEEAGTCDPDDYIVLSRDLSAWQGAHLFAVSIPVEEEEAPMLTGDFATKVFEGHYRDVKNWYGKMQAISDKHGVETDDVYFFYTTCPKCANAYGKNYVIGVTRIG